MPGFLKPQDVVHLLLSWSADRRVQVNSNIFPVLRNRRRDRFGSLSLRPYKLSHFLLAATLVLSAACLQTVAGTIVKQPDLYFWLFPLIVFSSTAYGGKWSGRFSVVTYLLIWPLATIFGDSRIISLSPSNDRLLLLAIESVLLVEVAGGWRTRSILAGRRAQLLAQSERNLRYVINHISDYVIILTNSGLVIEVNEAALKGTGAAAEEMLGRNLSETVWWVGKPQEKKIINQAVISASGGKPVRFDININDLNTGDDKILDLTLVPVSDNDKVSYLILSAADVSERVKTLEDNKILTSALEEEKGRIEEIINNTPGAVWEATTKIGSNKIRPRFLSNYIKTLTGFDPNELTTTKKWIGVVHSRDRSRVLKKIQEFAEKKSGGTIQYRMLTKWRKTLWVETNVVILSTKPEDSTKLMGVVVDISDRKKLEKRKDEFVSIASHELKTPLTTVKAFTQILKQRLSSNHDDKSYLYTIKMEDHLNKLTTIVTDFLDLSKIQTGKMDYRMEKIAFDQLVKEVVTDMQTTSETHKIVLKQKGGLEVYGDKNRLSQVLINLISNAIKYSPGADMVRVTTVAKDEWIVVRVKDYGIGVEKSQQEKIFERFYRAATGKRKVEGFGLGLFISSEIIKRHKGEIGVISSPGRGSEFFFRLPAAKDT